LTAFLAWPGSGGVMSFGAVDDAALVAALRGGDEAAFVWLVGRLRPCMLRLAMLHVPSREVAEEVVQDAWLAVLQQLDRFEGRSTLKTWIFRIVINRAKTRGARERRSVPFSSLAGVADAEAETDAGEPTVPAEWFHGANYRWSGHWAVPPASWEGIPEAWLVAKETEGVIAQAIDALPAAQRAVIGLRDVEGCSSAEVCTLLEVTEGNQRVLLHRARARVRATLAAYLDAARMVG